MSEKIRQYWDERAGQNAGELTATTQDVWMRHLEVATLIGLVDELAPAKGARIADMGCGDGNTLLALAPRFRDYSFRGFDYAPQMIETANNNLATFDADGGNLEFSVGDITNPVASVGEARLDIAMTDRCLINLDDSAAQFRALGEIARTLKPGGHYLAIENFHEGQDAMNAARAAMGLPEIQIRWHNHFFNEAEFRTEAAQHFETIEFREFASAYYYATRVIYSAMCRMQGTEPDYQHEIHQLAVKLPSIGNYSPIRLVILRKKG